MIKRKVEFKSSAFKGQANMRTNSPLQAFVRVLKLIQAEYIRFETPESRRRKEALREVFDEFEREGFKIAAFFGGSLGFGQSLENSDVDIRLLAGEGCEEEQVKHLLLKKIHQKLDGRVKVDFYFWGKFVDLLQVKRALGEIEADAIAICSAS